MNVRATMPQPIKAAGRLVSVRVGSVTADRRKLPSMILIGAQRAGTTSLFRALMSHPLVNSASYHKGVNYFDVNYHRDFSWYQGHFPTTASLLRRRRGVDGEPITFEASGYYMWHPSAPARIAHHLPEVRVLAMLRDPVERAFSAFKHELARGFETESSFEVALALEAGRMAGEAERMASEPTYQSFSHRHHAYLGRGHYADQLTQFRAVLPAAQIHVVESERFFEEPESTFAGVLDFLGLEHVMPARFDRWNGRPSSPLTARTRARLRDHFEEPDRALAALLQREPAWRT